MMVFATKWYCNGISMGLTPQTWEVSNILTYYNQSQVGTFSYDSTIIFVKQQDPPSPMA